MASKMDDPPPDKGTDLEVKEDRKLLLGTVVLPTAGDCATLLTTVFGLNRSLCWDGSGRNDWCCWFWRGLGWPEAVLPP